METTEYAFTTITSLPFEEPEGKVTEELKREGFGILIDNIQPTHQSFVLSPHGKRKPVLQQELFDGNW